MCAICDGATREEFRHQTLERIATHDYTMVAVEPTHHRGWVSPGSVYSIGLWTFRRTPELIVVGAPFRHAAEAIEQYAELAGEGTTFEPGQWTAEVVPGVRMVLERVARRHYQQWFAQSFDFYPDGDFPALQLLWPDRDGTWPWQSRFGRVNREPQPLLTETGRPESFDPPRPRPYQRR